jgi:hypothetical protein
MTPIGYFNNNMRELNTSTFLGREEPRVMKDYRENKKDLICTPQYYQ